MSDALSEICWFELANSTNYSKSALFPIDPVCGEPGAGDILPNSIDPASSGNTQLSFLSGDAYLVNSSEVWDLNAFPSGVVECDVNIVVMPGQTLAIQDLTILMAHKRSIRICPGANLVANNTQFTDLCGSTWRGFEVLGPCLSNLNPRGKVTLSNNCSIEHAECALRNHITKYPSAVGDNWFGGIWEISNSNFVDNMCDAVILNDVFSDFEGNIQNDAGYIYESCSFELNTLPIGSELSNFDINQTGHVVGIPSNGSIYYGIGMYGPRIFMGHTSGVSFHQCTFKNNNLSYGSSGTSQFSAITAINSSFRLRGGLDGNDTFSIYDSNIVGFRKGVNILGSFDFKTCVEFDELPNVQEVSLTGFQCFQGIDASMPGLLSVKKCLFEVLPVQYNMQGSAGANSVRFGSRIIGAAASEMAVAYTDNFHIEDPNGVGVRIGLYAINWGPNLNYVRSNTFRNFRGAYAYNNAVSCGLCIRDVCQNSTSNFGVIGTSGLRYECNIFENNIGDIYISASYPDPAWNNYFGPVRKQFQTKPSANSNSSAGNKFYSSVENPINPGGINQSFNYNDDIALGFNMPLNSPSVLGQRRYNYVDNELASQNRNGTHGSEMSSDYLFSTNVALNGGQIVQNDCDEVEIPPILNSTLTQIGVQIQDAIGQYQTMVDGGDSDQLLEKIRTADLQGAYELFQEIISTSPNLSTGALMEAIRNKYALPKSLIWTILLSNSNMLQDGKIQSELLKREDFSFGELNYLMNLPEITTVKAVLESQISDLITQREIYLNMARELISAGLWSQSQYTEFLMPDLLASDQLMLSFIKLNNGDIEGFQTGIESVKNQVSYDKDYISQLDALKSFIVESQEPSLTESGELDNTYQQYLRDIYQNDMIGVGQMARCMLLSYGCVVPDIDDMNKNRSISNVDFNSKSVSQSQPSIFPNPTADLLFVDLGVDGFISKKLIVTDIAGRYVMELPTDIQLSQACLDVRNLTPGVYQLQLLDAGNRVLRTNQFIKQ